MVGKNHKQILVILVERRTGYGLIREVKTKHADGVAAVIVSALKPLQGLVRTIPFDNGLEGAQHQTISATTGAKIYFADPYASWQRGTNENWNGLARQFFRKGECSSQIKQEDVQAAQRILNSRARKRFAWRTPFEALLPSANRAGVALAN